MPDKTDKVKGAPSPRPATLADVAREAGVSQATASRSLSGSGYAGEATRSAVLAAANHLDYRPNPSARALRTSRTATLGVLVPNLTNPVHLPLLEGIGQVARADGLALLVADGDRSAAIERDQADLLVDHRVDAIVVGGVLADRGLGRRLRRRGLAVAEVDVESLAAAEAQAIEAAADALLNAGHRRVALLTLGPTRADGPRRTADARAQRWRQALRRGGGHLAWRQVPPVHGVDATWVRRLVDRADGPSALVCGSLPLAPPLLSALRSAGIHIPNQVSLVLFGATPWAQAYDPPLATIELDHAGLGQALARQALDAIGSASRRPPSRWEVTARFEARGSVGPPAGARGG